MKTILQKLLITLVTISTFSQASENNMFVFQTTDVKIDDSKATLYMGTPVSIVKNVDDKNVLVEFSGVSFEDKLYTNKDKSLLMASTVSSEIARPMGISTQLVKGSSIRFLSDSRLPKTKLKARQVMNKMRVSENILSQDFPARVLNSF